MLSDVEFNEFSAMCTAEDNRVYLSRWKHISSSDSITDGRPLRVIKAVRG